MKKDNTFDPDRFCKSMAEQYAYLTGTLGLTDADITTAASSIVAPYPNHDVIELEAEDYDALRASLKARHV